MATGKWCEAGVPHRGWTLVEVVDLGRGASNHETCEMCEAREIRYAHILEHASHGALSVGCDCAEKMIAGYVGAQLERKLINRSKRRLAWTRREWGTTAQGNRRLSVRGYVFVVVEKPNGWTATLKESGAAMWIGGRRTFGTRDEAKLALFDYVWPARIKR